MREFWKLPAAFLAAVFLLPSLSPRAEATDRRQSLPQAGPYSGNAPPASQQTCTDPASSCLPLPRDMTRDAKPLQNNSYDYIIIGAGNAGLVVANRLTEDPKVRVLVVEAGDDTRKDVTVYKANETYALNNVPGGPHVHQYPTVPQINDSIKMEWYGKGLGGSTTVNGQVWDAPHKSQVDDIGKLGNAGWDWQTLLKYYIKAQDYHKPSPELKTRFGIVYKPDAHRAGGPVTIAHLPQTFSGPPQQAFVRAVKSLLGINPGDLQSGDNNAVAFVPQTLYPDTDLRRVSSATSYYEPISEKRPNLTILLTWRVIKLVFDDATTEATDAANKTRRAEPAAKRVHGVMIQNKPDGVTYKLTAARFILSAGSIASPYILEHSGVGDAQILSKIDATPVIDLPGVGRNFGEQTQVGLNAPVANRSWRGLGASGSIVQPTVHQLFANVSEVEHYVRSQHTTWAQAQVDAGGAVSKESAMKQYELMTTGIFKSNVPINENFFGNGFYGNESALSMSVYTLTPYARGYTHANVSDPWANPEVNPRYYTVPFDMDMEVASLRAGKRLFNTTELRRVSADPAKPVPENDDKSSGVDKKPDADNGDDTSGDKPPPLSLGASSPDCNCTANTVEEYAFLRSHVIESFGILDHAVGTCSMMPRAMGGVVDSRFRVYGIDNLRIVDASVLPMQISAHPQATVYAIAEYASDLIRTDDASVGKKSSSTTGGKGN